MRLGLRRWQVLPSYITRHHGRPLMRDFTIKVTNLALSGGGEDLAFDIFGRPMLDGIPIPDDIVKELDREVFLSAIKDYEVNMLSNLDSFKRLDLGCIDEE
jgi:hypothetical protein